MESDNVTTITFQWSSTVIATTATVLVVIIISLCLILFVSKYQVWFKVLFGSICAAALFYGAYNVPISISLNKESLVINHLLRKTMLPRGSITDIVPLSDNIIDESRRKFGSGGFFGYLGKFSNHKIGEYTLYATDNKNLILIKTNTINYVVNCTDINKIKHRADMKEDSENEK